MGKLLIEPNNQEERKLIEALLKRMNIKSQYLSDAELEELVIASETIKGSKTQRVSEKDVMKILNKDNES